MATDREPTVPSEVISLENEVRAFKAKQYLGSSSFRSYPIQSENDWDFTKTTSAAPLNYAQLGVIYESESGITPSAQLTVKAEINGTPYDPSTIEFNSAGYIFVDFMVLGVYSPDLYTKPGVMVWNVFCKADAVKTFKIKAYVRASDKGSLRFVDFGL